MDESRDTAPVGRLRSVVLDAADITGLAGFYQALAGLDEHHSDQDWISLATGSGQRLAFQLAPDHTAPRWPDPAHPQQMHLDFQVPDVAAAVARAEELGARRLRGEESYVVLADPAGHPFCLCRADVAEVRLADVAVDTPDAAAAAPFYARLLGQEVTYSGPAGAMLGGAGGLPVMFQNVAPYQPPRWPDPARPQQLQLDVEVAEIEAGEAAALAAGARRLGGGEEGPEGGFRVYADPDGHPFCLVWG